MLIKDVGNILDENNNEDGIAKIIIKSLITYYSVNTFTDDFFKENYTAYLTMIFRKWKINFIEEDMLLSYKDYIKRTVLESIHDDIAHYIDHDEIQMAYGWEEFGLSKIITALFDNKEIFPIIHSS